MATLKQITRRMVWLVLLALVSFLLGQRAAHAVPPGQCLTCACKDMYAWRLTQLPQFGEFSIDFPSISQRKS